MIGIPVISNLTVTIKDFPKIKERLDIRYYRQALEYTSMYWINRTAYALKDLIILKFFSGRKRTRTYKGNQNQLGKGTGAAANAIDVQPSYAKIGGLESIQHVAQITIDKEGMLPYIRRWVTEDSTLAKKRITSRGKAFTFPLSNTSPGMSKAGMHINPWHKPLLGRFEGDNFYGRWVPYFYVNPTIDSTPKVSLEQIRQSPDVSVLFERSRSLIRERLEAKIRERG